MDVHVTLKGRGDLTARIYRQSLDTVLDGRLHPGERLPATRELARRLDVSRNTVSLAYERLVAEGVFTSRVGAGTFVCRGWSVRRARVVRLKVVVCACGRSGGPSRNRSRSPDWLLASSGPGLWIGAVRRPERSLRVAIRDRASHRHLARRSGKRRRCDRHARRAASARSHSQGHT